MTAPIAIVLAAGGSTRMGRSKALLDLRGTPLIQHHVRALQAVGRVLVVVGHRAAEVQRAVPDVACVRNRAWARTDALTSLRLALTVAGPTECVWAAPVDTPPASAHTLTQLQGCACTAVPVGPDGEPGHPVVVRGTDVVRLREAQLDEGLRTLVADALRVPVADNVGYNFNEPESWRRFQERHPR